ncbi:MAG: hypothetical protein AMXMBFR34_25490 [Myxococcaceae bacterium]
MRAVGLLCLLSFAAAAAEAAAQPERDPLFLEAQTWTVAPITKPGWLLGGSAKASVGRFGLAVSGYQQALYGRAGTSTRMGALVASMTAAFRLSGKILMGVSAGANTLFFEPDVASIAPSLGFFSRFDYHPMVSVQLQLDVAAWPHYRMDAVTEVRVHWRRAFLSLGMRLVHVEGPRRLGIPLGEATTIGVQVALGVDWSG